VRRSQARVDDRAQCRGAGDAFYRLDVGIWDVGVVDDYLLTVERYAFGEATIGIDIEKWLSICSCGMAELYGRVVTNIRIIHGPTAIAPEPPAVQAAAEPFTS